MLLLCAQMRDDIRAERAAFDTLRTLAAEDGAEITALRVLDVLVWRTADSWH